MTLFSFYQLNSLDNHPPMSPAAHEVINVGGVAEKAINPGTLHYLYLKAYYSYFDLRPIRLMIVLSMPPAAHQVGNPGETPAQVISRGTSPLLDCYILISLTHMYRVPAPTRRNQLHRRIGTSLSDVSGYSNKGRQWLGRTLESKC